MGGRFVLTVSVCMVALSQKLREMSYHQRPNYKVRGEVVMGVIRHMTLGSNGDGSVGNGGGG